MATAAKQKTKNTKVAVEFNANQVIELNKLTSWKKIGEGGCGEVFSVEHEHWGPMAIKKLGVTSMNERYV